MSTMNTNHHVPVRVIIKETVQTPLELMEQLLVRDLVTRTHDGSVVDSVSLEIAGVVVFCCECQVEDQTESLATVRTSSHCLHAVLWCESDRVL